MKVKTLALFIAISLTSSCANQPDDRKLAWDVKPALDIHHGMSQLASRLQLGFRYQATGNTAAAEAAFNEALRIDPRNVEALNALGKLYAESGDLERSAAAFRRITEQEPRRAYLYNNIGFALHLQGRNAEAIETLLKAIRLDPTYERAWVNLEEVAKAAGNIELAGLASRRELAPDTLLAGATQATAPLAATNVQPPSEDMPPLTLAYTILIPASALQTAEVPATPNGKLVMTNDLRPDVAIRVTPVPVVSIQTEPVIRRVSFAPSITQVDKRIEISNANGIRGLATRLGQHLRSDGAKIARITNYSSFRVPQTTIEYRPGYLESAKTLRDRLGIEADLKEANLEQRRVDVRIILGKNCATQVTRLLNPTIRNLSVISKADSETARNPRGGA